MKKIRNSLSVFLSVILIFCSLAPVLATTSDTSLGNISTTEQVRVKEIESLRTSNSETYQMSDGTFQCVVLSEDKYYLNDNKQYTEINNEIITQNTKTSLNDYTYKNTANAYDVYFSDNDIMSMLLQKEDKSISFSPLQSLEPEVKIGYTRTRVLNEIEDVGTNCISYQNVYPGVDMMYVVESNQVKEYIIINDIQAQTKFDFNLNTEGLTISETENNINFLDSAGEVIFSLGSLYAVDSNEIYTDDVNYSLVLNEGSESGILSIEISDDYVNDEARVFPIIIDPSVMVSSSATIDSYISSKYPDQSYASYTYLRTGRDEDYYTRRTFIRFKLPTYLDADYITSAYLRLKYYSGAEPNLRTYRVNGDWGSGTVSWNNKPNYSESSCSTAMTKQDNNWYQIGITTITKSWIRGTYRNDGLMLKDAAESGTTQWTTFYSSDAPSPNKPELIINYSNERQTKHYNVDVYYNSDMSTSDVENISYYFTTARDTINDAFNVFFSRTGTLSSSALNQNETNSICTRSGSICNYTCGTLSDCESLHHKSGYRILNLSNSSGNKVVRYVDYRTCRYKDGVHKEIYGVTTSDDMRVMVSLRSDNPIRTTVHELSHTIGAHDNSCVVDAGADCVMTYGSNTYCMWCRQCSKDMFEYLDNN